MDLLEPRRASFDQLAYSTNSKGKTYFIIITLDHLMLIAAHRIEPFSASVDSCEKETENWVILLWADSFLAPPAGRHTVRCGGLGLTRTDFLNVSDCTAVRSILRQTYNDIPLLDAIIDLN